MWFEGFIVYGILRDMKTKTVYICTNCGARDSRWQGKCPACGEWNTFEEQVVTQKGKGSVPVKAGRIEQLLTVTDGAMPRFSSGLSELDMVLGGGVVPGSLILLGGDPGIGKSTLALQTALLLAGSGKSVLYVSGEESAYQIRLRKDRIDKSQDLSVLAETDLESILETVRASCPDVLVVDSIQTVNSSEVNGVVGGVSQISFATNALMRMAKSLHIATFIIGHVTKEGMLAGPKTLEHMVDAVLYLEGERFTSLRLLRCQKNRFGGTGEVGVFDMRESGLVEVGNPSSLFLGERSESASGTCITPILEGNKVLLLEVQALVTKANFNYPKRAASGFDVNRLQLLLAILQKRLNYDFSNLDVFINVTGGFELGERAADLPVALSILSSVKDFVLPNTLAAFGEIGLSGEVRGVSQADKRVKEAVKLGFTEIVCGGKVAADKKAHVQNIKKVTDLFSIIKK